MSARQKERKEVKVRVKGMRVEVLEYWGIEEGQLTLFSEGL